MTEGTATGKIHRTGQRSEKRDESKNRAFFEKLADEADTAATTQNIAALYKITKTLAGGFKNSEVPVKDVNGNVITGAVEQTQRWKSHFGTILNKEAPNNLSDIPVSNEDLEINTDPPSAEEGRKTASSMKSGKAPGADGVSADVLKAG